MAPTTRTIVHMSSCPRHDAIYVIVDTEMRGLELEVE